MLRLFKKMKGRIINALSKQNLLSIGKSVSLIMILQVAAYILSFASSIIIARGMSVADKGEYNVVVLFKDSIVEFGMIGFASGMLFYQLKGDSIKSAIKGNAILFSLIWGAIVFAALIVFKEYVFRYIKGMDNINFYLVIAVTAFSFFHMCFSNFLLGEDKAIVLYCINFGVSLFQMLVVSFITILHLLSVRILVLMVVFVSAALFFIDIIIWRKNVLKTSFDFKLLIKMIKYGAVVYLGVIFNYITFKIDQYYLNYYLGTESVAIYSLSVSLAQVLFFLDTAITAASIQKITIAEETEAQFLVKGIIKTQLVVELFFAVLLGAISYPMIVLLYGEAYSSGVIPLLVLMPGVIVWSIGKIASQYITYKCGKPQICTLAAFIGALVNCIFNAWFIPKSGLNGAAIASTFSYVIVSAFVFISFYHFSRRRRNAVL